MATYEIVQTETPKYDPSRTTGDQTEKTSLIVEWTDEPSDRELRRFADQYPPHLYEVFHYCEGLGSFLDPNCSKHDQQPLHDR
ncbi:hypothetical protein [Epibacterium ulvae]|uniref:hypothetical protein n=1 Tax=Epibacterium ulvae TaxID=1156985 RepID=UPI00249108CC|nr:hypothetical protein [Epibacterium ulvae]